MLSCARCLAHLQFAVRLVIVFPASYCMAPAARRLEALVRAVLTWLCALLWLFKSTIMISPVNSVDLLEKVPSQWTQVPCALVAPCGLYKVGCCVWRDCLQ